MKNLFVALLLCCAVILPASLEAQVTTPVIRANFGVDGELNANFFNGAILHGNDDWFRNNGNIGKYIIDTTGATYLLNQYSATPNIRKIPFFRGMRYPQMTVINNYLLLDALFIRDHHGDDSSVFTATVNKNGQSPASWVTPVSQGAIPDKTDIFDMMMHARRDGPLVTDSLWLFGGLSMDPTSASGNRFFDFELFQTDIQYHHSTLSFSGYGPDAGHTSWQFDASGNVIKAGDVIISVEFGNLGLTTLEARIWIDKAALLITPAGFTWGGQFDGDNAASTYGYASILPLVAGEFYAGSHSAANSWVGPFNHVLQNNSLTVLYTAKEYMEFSVNLSKLGLNQLSTSLNPCDMPFRRILAKSRATAAFTGELKDFVAPFDFFRTPRVAASPSVPSFCGTTGTSIISVSNPLLTSLYSWTTPDGTIVGDRLGPSIEVSTIGNYILSQQLMDSCGIVYAHDTVNVFQDMSCSTLKISVSAFRAERQPTGTRLTWESNSQDASDVYEIEKRIGSGTFSTIARLNNKSAHTYSYSYTDTLPAVSNELVLYRLKVKDINGHSSYSNTVSIPPDNQAGMKLAKGSAPGQISILLSSDQTSIANIAVYDISGTLILSARQLVQKGKNVFPVHSLLPFKPGIYVVKVLVGNHIFSDKIVCFN